MKKIAFVFILILAFIISINENIEAKGKKQPKIPKVLTQDDIIKRIKNEEKVLEKDLDGYIEYEKKVKYRLIPFIW